MDKETELTATSVVLKSTLTSLKKAGQGITKLYQANINITCNLEIPQSKELFLPEN